MAYLLDANVFIQANNEFYQFSFMPGFWEWLENELESGDVLSINIVYDEVYKLDARSVNKEILEWLKKNKEFFKDCTNDPETTKIFNRLQKSLAEKEIDRGKKQYSQATINEFFDVADSWLIAYASAYDHTIVTFEKSSPRSTKRIKIPDVAKLVNVECINLYNLLVKKHPVFVLAPSITNSSSDSSSNVSVSSTSTVSPKTTSGSSSTIVSSSPDTPTEGSSDSSSEENTDTNSSYPQESLF